MYDIKDHFKRAEIVHSRIERGICRACGKEPAMKGEAALQEVQCTERTSQGMAEESEGA